MNVRHSKIIRNTKETAITLSLELDGTGKSEIATGCGFLDHMLTLFASHGRFDLAAKCQGDYHVDFHHTVEDVGICLGLAFAQALGDKRGITRYGSMILPMDEALIMTAIDFSGRSYLGWEQLASHHRGSVQVSGKGNSSGGQDKSRIRYRDSVDKGNNIVIAYYQQAQKIPPTLMGGY